MELSPRAQPLRAGFLALLAVLSGACARQAPPPGGPPDLTAPTVLSVLPESLAVGVSPQASLVITFSERIDPQSLERALWVTPGGGAKPRISGRTEVEVRFANPLPESSTVAVLLTTTLRDQPLVGTQNLMKEPYRWIFSTGSALWPGSLHGSVKQPEETGGTARERSLLLVAVFRAEGDTVPDFAALYPEAITQATTRGIYDLAGLPADGERLWVVAMLDRNGNREISGPGEFYSAKPETLRLTAETPEREVPLALVNPSAPGEIRGRLVIAAGDSTAVVVQLYEAKADSSAGPRYQRRAAPAGDYTLSNVAPGTYLVAAYCDQNGNGRREPEEPGESLGTVTLPPGETFEMSERAGPCPPP